MWIKYVEPLLSEGGGLIKQGSPLSSLMVNLSPPSFLRRKEVLGWALPPEPFLLMDEDYVENPFGSGGEEEEETNQTTK
jgi:hypothetical protein